MKPINKPNRQVNILDDNAKIEQAIEAVRQKLKFLDTEGAFAILECDRLNQQKVEQQNKLDEVKLPLEIAEAFDSVAKLLERLSHLKM